MPAAPTIPIGIALGSNLGDRQANLTSGFAFLESIAADGHCLASSMIESQPVDCPDGSGSFLNAVAEIQYDAAGDPYAVLDLMLAFETEMGRLDPTERERNAPRPLDLDLLYFGQQVIHDPPRLMVPHPRLTERSFVLTPLAEIRPKLILPGQTQAITDLAKAAEDQG